MGCYRGYCVRAGGVVSSKPGLHPGLHSSWWLQADRSTPCPPSALCTPAASTRTPRITKGGSGLRCSTLPSPCLSQKTHARLCLPPPAASPRRMACRHTSAWLAVTAAQIADGYKQVAALLDHLNVDAANPLAVLTQVRTAHLCCSRSQSFFWGGQGCSRSGWTVRGAPLPARCNSTPSQRRKVPLQAVSVCLPARAVPPCSGCVCVSSVSALWCAGLTHSLCIVCGSHSLLLQDTARNFLCGSVADKKKYEIFMKVG